MEGDAGDEFLIPEVKEEFIAELFATVSVFGFDAGVCDDLCHLFIGYLIAYFFMVVYHYLVLVEGHENIVDEERTGELHGNESAILQYM